MEREWHIIGNKGVGKDGVRETSLDGDPKARSGKLHKLSGGKQIRCYLMNIDAKVNCCLSAEAGSRFSIFPQV